jgi:hypothetical protein
MLPGTELAFAEDVEYDNRWIWKRAINFRVGKFGAIEPDVPHLFDHLVGAGKDGGRHGETERFGGLEVDDKLEVCRLLYREVFRIFTPQNATDVNPNPVVCVGKIAAITDQATSSNIIASGV